MSASADIFLSYNREDQATARRFAEAFEREGFSVWWDATLRSGEAYDQVTEKALKTAKAVAVLWSKKSVVSRWVRAEATLADRNKTLVPAMIEPCDRPIMFELTQTADLSHWQGDADDPAWRSYVADVRRFIDGDRPAPSAAAIPRMPTPATPERGGEPNLVVLPVASRSGLPEDEAFAADLTSELIAELIRYGWARVVTAAATDRRSAVDLRVLARELDARYVVETHVRRIGPTLRLMVQLLEAQSGSFVWTQKYDRPLDDLAGAEEALGVEAASHISEQQILRLEFDRAVKKSGGWSAWERTLRSFACTVHLSSDSTQVAIEEARQALAIAPDYALAQAMLAWALGVGIGFFGHESAREEVRLHIKRAVDLDRNDPRVLRLVSTASSTIGDFQTALRSAKRAVELTPHVANGHFCLAFAYLGLGQNAEAIAALDSEQTIAPQVHNLYISQHLRALALFSQGHLADAREALDRSLELNANFVLTQKWRAIVSERLGAQEEARQAVRDLRAMEPSLTLEDHISQIMLTVPDPARAEAVAALRRIWAVVEVTA